jgi:hypothetical protein
MAMRFKPLDYYFLLLALAALILGGIIVGRGLLLGGTWNYIFFGILLLGFGAYRLVLFLHTWRAGRPGEPK